jgi:hypothetical protein
MQNPRQRGLTVKEYTEEFYKLNISVGQRERYEENVARYINGLRYDIEDKISMVTVKIVEDAYQIVLKEEEKLNRKKSHQNKGRSLNRGKVVSQDKSPNPKYEVKKPHSHSERVGIS